MDTKDFFPSRIRLVAALIVFSVVHGVGTVIQATILSVLESDWLYVTGIAGASLYAILEFASALLVLAIAGFVAAAVAGANPYLVGTMLGLLSVVMHKLLTAGEDVLSLATDQYVGIALTIAAPVVGAVMWSRRTSRKSAPVSANKDDAHDWGKRGSQTIVVKGRDDDWHKKGLWVARK